MNEDQKQLLVMRVIWGALTASIFFYLSVGYMVSQTPPVQLFDLRLEPAFYLVAVIDFLVAVFLPRYLFNLAKTKLLAGGDVSMKKMANAFFVPFLIRMALFESVTVFGLVLTLLSHNPAKMLPFAALTLIGQAMNFPTVSGVRAKLGFQ